MPNFGYDPRDEDGCRCAGFTCTCGAYRLSMSDVAHPDFARHETARIREMEGRRPWVPEERRIGERSMSVWESGRDENDVSSDEDCAPPARRAFEPAPRKQQSYKTADADFRRTMPEPFSPPTCPGCGVPTKLVGGDAVYPHRPDLAGKSFWACLPCDAYVGCHPGTDRPLGTPAQAPLRALRSKVHAALDPLWRSGRMARREAYAQLAAAMGIPERECHVGMFGEDRCHRALEVLTGGGLTCGGV